MRNCRSILLVLSLCVLTFNGMIAQASEKPTSMEIGYMDFEKVPFWAKNKVGLDLDLIRMAAGKLGIIVNFRSMPWRRCQKLLGTNELQGIIGASYKESRTKIGQYPFKPDGKVDDIAALHMDG
jgi:polar amino acid transport system substrate-binding protein